MGVAASVSVVDRWLGEGWRDEPGLRWAIAAVVGVAAAFAMAAGAWAMFAVGLGVPFRVRWVPGVALVGLLFTWIVQKALRPRRSRPARRP